MITIGNIGMRLVLAFSIALVIVATPLISAIHTNPALLTIGNPFAQVSAALTSR